MACSSSSAVLHQSRAQQPQRRSNSIRSSTSSSSLALPSRRNSPAASAAAAASAASPHLQLREQQQEDGDAALLALLRAHDTEAAFRLFSSSPDVLPSSPTTASRLLAQLSFNSDSSFSRGTRLLQRLRARDALSLLDANALSLAASAAARSRNGSELGRSLILYMLRQGLFPDRRAYTAVVASLSPPAKALRLFEAVLRHLRRRRDEHEDAVPPLCLPDTAAFNAALNACADAGDCHRFRSLSEEMSCSWGLEWDAVSYNVAMKMCARAGRKDLVARVLERMLAAGVTPCATTFHSLVAAYVGFGDIRTAESIVQAMRQGSSCLSLLRFLLSQSEAQEEAEQRNFMPGAEQLEDVVLVPAGVGGGVEVNAEQTDPTIPGPSARVYTTLMKGYTHAGRVDDVVATLRAMLHEAKTVPDQVTFTTAMSALVAAGQVERARAVLDRDMAAAGVPPNRVTYNVLLKGYCQQLQMSEARRLFFHDMATSGIEPDVVSYNTLMDGCVRTDDTAGALALFEEMRSRGVAPSAVTYTTLMKAFAASGQPKLAHQVFHQMQSDARVTIDRAAWNMLIEAYCRLGLLDTAKQLVEDMKRLRIHPDVATYGSLAKAVAVARRPGEALLLWNEVKERCPDPDEDLLQALADVCVKAAFFKKALEIVACMEERGIAPDKAKYKRMYVEMHSRMFTSRHASQARQDRRRERKRAAEAFKFWLGLPNEYYGTTTSDWRVEPDGDE